MLDSHFFEAFCSRAEEPPFGKVLLQGGLTTRSKLIKGGGSLFALLHLDFLSFVPNFDEAVIRVGQQGAGNLSIGFAFLRYCALASLRLFRRSQTKSNIEALWCELHMLFSFDVVIVTVLYGACDDSFRSVSNIH